MKEYNYLRYNSDFTICFGPVENVQLEKYNFHPETQYIFNPKNKGYELLRDLDLSNTKLVGIEGGAFFNTPILIKAKFPDTFKEMGMEAFASSGIKKIDFSNTILTEIPTGCFDGCERLISVLLPETLEVLETECFKNCESLKEITLPDNVTAIEKGAFFKSGIEKVEFSKKLRYIKEDAFSDSKLKEANLSKTRLRKIDTCAFLTPSLTNIILPKTLKEIGWKAFAYTSLKELTLPFGIEKIDKILPSNSIQKLVYHGVRKEILDEIHEELELKKVKERNVEFINDSFEYMLGNGATFKTINHTTNEYFKDTKEIEDEL